MSGVFDGGVFDSGMSDIGADVANDVAEGTNSGGYLTLDDRRVNQIREEDIEIMDFIKAFLEAA